MIDPQKLELGMRIVHAKDGFGTIERLDQSSNICTVKYDSGITANGLDTSLICKSSITPEEEAFDKNLADFNRNLELLKNSVNKILQKISILKDGLRFINQ